MMESAILKAQSIGVDSVTGATGSSTGIKNAVRDALTQAYMAAGSSETEAESAINSLFMASSVKGERLVELDTDVVVVGAGAAGTVASLTALDRGVRVLNVEKTFRWGGSP